MNYAPRSSAIVAAVAAADCILAIDASVGTENVARAAERAVVVHVEAAFLAVGI